jgi:integrase
MKTLATVWSYAADRIDDAPRTPVRLKRQWIKPQPRTRHVSDDSLKEFYDAVMALESPIVRDYILLLLFTGMRRREAASLRWADIDLKAKVIHVAADNTKSGRKLDLPMCDVIHDMLKERRATGNAGGFVFPAGASKSGHIEEPKFQFKQIADATGIRVSPHDLRRTFITVAESCDLSWSALKALVNHKLGSGITENYIQMHAAERLREPVQKVADKLKEYCGIPLTVTHR